MDLVINLTGWFELMNLFTSLGILQLKKGKKRGKKTCQIGIFTCTKDTVLPSIFFSPWWNYSPSGRTRDPPVPVHLLNQDYWSFLCWWQMTTPTLHVPFKSLCWTRTFHSSQALGCIKLPSSTLAFLAEKEISGVSIPVWQRCLW